MRPNPFSMDLSLDFIGHVLLLLQRLHCVVQALESQTVLFHRLNLSSLWLFFNDRVDCITFRAYVGKGHIRSSTRYVSVIISNYLLNYRLFFLVLRKSLFIITYCLQEIVPRGTICRHWLALIILFHVEQRQNNKKCLKLSSVPML